MVILMMPRPASRICSEIRFLMKNLILEDTSFHQPIPLISEDLFRRLYIMYMHIRDFLQTVRYQRMRRSISLFLQVISVIYLQLILQCIWVSLLISLYVHPMRTRCSMTSSQQEHMTGTESLCLHHLRQWTFLYQVTLRDLYI